MLKFLPLVLAFFLSLSNFQFHDHAKNPANINFADLNKIKNPRNHLTQDSENRHEVTAQVLSVSEAATINRTAEKISGNAAINHGEIILRLTWKIIPYAVKYAVTCEENIFVSYTNGVEIPVKSVNSDFKVAALDYDNNVVEDDVVVYTVEENPPAPLTATEFDKMNFPPVYLVYTWIPTLNADHYEIQLLKDGEICRNYVTNFHPQDDNFDFYDERALLEEGNYFWRIRGISAEGAIITEWSEQNAGNSFTVTRPARYCALGDSITHGGGCISVPPSMVFYNWQNYCKFPIKNLAKSGDTTEKMLNRFERDILPFSPEILFIMAGVNDYRNDILGWDSVKNLSALRDKCETYGIKPVFITPTPINPQIISKVKFVNRPPYDWRDQRKYICDWIKRQENFIDIEDALSDYQGYLREDLSVDGLHPDAEGKEIIGRAVENWIENYSNTTKGWEDRD